MKGKNCLKFFALVIFHERRPMEDHLTNNFTSLHQGAIFLPTREQMLQAGIQFLAILGLKFLKVVVYPLILKGLQPKQSEIGLDFRFF